MEKENLKALLQVSLRIAKITMGREVVTQSNHLEVNCWHQRHIVFVVSMKRTGTETSASRWIISESRQEKEIGRTRTQATSRKAVSALKNRTTVNLAKVSSDYKELDINIAKETNHVERPAKERHIRVEYRYLCLLISYGITRMVKQGGVTSLWRVSSLTVHRAMIVTASQLASYDHTRMVFCLLFGFVCRARGGYYDISIRSCSTLAS
ncbi:putative clathrin assembly protein [Tanacetum coccineum]